MTTEQIYSQLTEIFRDLFDDPSIVLQPQTSAADVSGWDSFAHVNLLMAVESQFGVKFKTADLEAIQSVGDLAEFIKNKA